MILKIPDTTGILHEVETIYHRGNWAVIPYNPQALIACTVVHIPCGGIILDHPYTSDECILLVKQLAECSEFHTCVRDNTDIELLKIISRFEDTTEPMRIQILIVDLSYDKPEVKQTEKKVN